MTSSAIPKIPDLLDLSLPQLQELFVSWGEKPFRAKQVFEWLHRKAARDFASMSNLSNELRDKLGQRSRIGGLEINRKQVSLRDGTAKFLYACADGETIETVFLPHEGRNTACVSTQVGCAMACTFCATGDSGFGRNLSPGEILAQVFETEREMGQSIDNLVFMGMGEPLHNWAHVETALRILCDSAGRHWGPRHLTLSTCGVVSGIDALTDSGLKVRLAVSLHAADDETRGRIMPINRRYPLKELMRSLRDYQKKTGLELTFEYTLFDGVNDSPEQARAVARLIGGLEAKINLIPYNPVAGLPFHVPDFTKIMAFQKILKDSGRVVLVRTEKGGDIDAACGQLRRKDAEGRDIRKVGA